MPKEKLKKADIKENYSIIEDEEKDYLRNASIENRKLIKWTKPEETLLLKNMNKYAKEYGIENIADFLYDSSSSLRKFKIETEFIPRLMLGIVNRNRMQVYLKIKRMFRDSQLFGKWSEDDEKELIRLHQIHDNNWRVIAQELKRDPVSCQIKYNRSTLKCQDAQTGPWDIKECKLLQDAVIKLTNANKNEFVYKNVPWNEVSKLVETRSGPSCRDKWISSYCWMGDFTKRVIFKKIHLNTTLKTLESMKYSTWNDIDWDHVWELCGKCDIAPSPQSLCGSLRAYTRRVLHLVPEPDTIVKKFIHQLKFQLDGEIHQSQSSEDDDR